MVSVTENLQLMNLPRSQLKLLHSFVGKYGLDLTDDYDGSIKFLTDILKKSNKNLSMLNQKVTELYPETQR